ncbi:hypothetical protein [Lentzea sp. NPDC004782]|uniref:hypothetical protein n=1 Tax=Lentzea sp. NPDC004782 TaxID=3154458 RepID=UPI0033BCB4C1
MPSTRTSAENWMKLPHVLKNKLDTISFDEKKVAVNYSGNGAWVYLEGMRVRLGDEVFAAHITITKSPVSNAKVDSDPWTLCHLTLNRAHNSHVFYEWDENAAKFRKTTNVIDRDGKHRAAKEHFRIDDSQINDPDLVNAVKEDMRLIFDSLV